MLLYVLLVIMVNCTSKESSSFRDVGFSMLIYCVLLAYLNMSHVMRKLDFCLCKNKGADQHRSNCEADQHLCFRYTDSTIPLLRKSKISRF